MKKRSEDSDGKQWITSWYNNKINGDRDNMEDSNKSILPDDDNVRQQQQKLMELSSQYQPKVGNVNINRTFCCSPI